MLLAALSMAGNFCKNCSVLEYVQLHLFYFLVINRKAASCNVAKTWLFIQILLFAQTRKILPNNNKAHCAKEATHDSHVMTVGAATKLRTTPTSPSRYVVREGWFSSLHWAAFDAACPNIIHLGVEPSIDCSLQSPDVGGEARESSGSCPTVRTCD